MSYRSDQFLKYKVGGSIPGETMLLEMNFEDIHHLFLEVLNSGVHGFCFSLYEDGQRPGDHISEGQIRRRLEILRPHTSWIRSFSTTEGNELIPAIAKEMGMRTLVGAWLSDDLEKNEEELEGLLQLSRQGLVDIAAVGNEVLYRKDLTVSQLLEYIKRVKNQVQNIPVGYVDAYYEFVTRPEVTDACDIILSNCYPFWEGTSYDHALQHIKHMYDQAKNAGGGKRVIITETGWPSFGETLGGAVPSNLNALKYFINTQLWAMDEGIEVFYFSSFDESWKVDAEGTVGAYWGIWDKHEKLKFSNVQ